MARIDPDDTHEKVSTLAVLLAEWLRFGHGGAVLLVVNVAAAVCAAVYGPVAADAAAGWRAARIAGPGDVIEPFAIDVLNDVMVIAAGIVEAVPVPVLAGGLGFGVFWAGRRVAFGVLRHLIARGPRWERIVTGLACEYHSDDPAAHRRACILYGFKPYPSGLFGIPARSVAARRDTV